MVYQALTRQFQCNSRTTLDYITGIRSFNEKYWINEKGVKADGPLFALPGGDVKALPKGSCPDIHNSSSAAAPIMQTSIMTRRTVSSS